MKYANFCDTGRCNINIGDYLQFIAAEYLLKKMEIPTDEIVRLGFDDIDKYDGEDVIFPFCYSVIDFVKSGKISISKKIHPVFFAVTLTTIDKFMDVDVFLTDKFNADYFIEHGPIGCRDEITYHYFKSHNIPAYINGCMTAILPKSSKNGDKVLFVDAPMSLLPFIPSDMLKEKCEFSTQQYYFSSEEIADHKKIFDFVYKKYDEYIKKAKLVITSRLHIALPMCAFGIPVILAKEHIDGRFSFIEKYIPAYDKEHFDQINWHPSVPDMDNIKKILIDHAVERLEIFNDNSLNEKEIYLTEFYKSRKICCTYNNSHSVTHNNGDIFDEYAAQNWDNDKPIKYAFWGVSDNNYEYWINHITMKYPMAELTAIFDSFRSGEFHGFWCQRPENLLSDDYNETKVIVCSVGAAQAAKKLFRKMQIDKKRYCIAADCFIENEDIIEQMKGIL